MSIFAALTVYHDIDSRAAALNMAIDEALLERATEPAIRFYRWDHPALSFGYFGKFNDVAEHERERDIVRRWTGGGIVFHGEDLTYSILIPANAADFSESPMSVYEKVHRAVQRALWSTGERAELSKEKTPNVDSRSPDRSVASPGDQCSPSGGFPARRIQRPTPNAQFRDACFANPVKADVMVNGRKIAGAAQRRARRGLLQQGSIQNVELAPTFEKNFAAQLSANCCEHSINDALVQRGQQIAEEKYATAAWLRRR